MWAAAAWLNDPAFASEDAIAKLVGENDRLLELLSIGHSDTLTSRVAFYLAFRAKPSLDYVMLLVQRLSENSPELRHGRALYPWLRAVSWIAANHTGRDVLLLVEVDIGLVQKSFQLSSTAPPSLATECQRELSEVILPWLHLSYLANQLEKLLLDSSSETHTTVEQIQQFEINLSVADYLRLLSEPDLGRRMVAYVRLAAQPVSDPRIVPLMLNTLPQKSEDTSETTVAFALYWSLEAIAKAIASGQDYSTIVMPYRERLLAARESLPPNSEGVLLIDQILAAEPVALSGASDSSTPIQQFAILCSAGKDVNVPAGASGEWLFGELFHQALATIIQSEKMVTLQSIFDYISNEGKHGSGSAAPLLYLSSHPGLGQFPLLNLDTDFLNKPDESNKSNKRRAILISAVNYTERSEIHAKREAVLAITANLLHAAGNFDSTCLLGEQASKSNLLDLVHKSNEQAGPGDTLLLYFSGGRVEWDDGALRIFLADSGDGRPETAFTGPELATLIRQRNFTNNILVFDTEMAASFVPYFQS